MVSKTGTGTINIKGRVDSTNAASVEEKILNLHTEGAVTLDFGELIYISSAGLRVLLKLKKTFGGVTVENVSPEVYEIFQMTGFDNLLNVKKALREVSIDGCTLLGKGGTGSVYRIDEETVVKVFNHGTSYDAIDKEREYAKTAFTNGVPTAIAYDVVKVGDCYGTVFECINSETLGGAFQKYPERFDEFIDKYVSLCRTINRTRIEGGIFESIKAALNRRVDRLSAFLPKEDIAMLHEIIHCMPESDTLVHGDLHTGNVMLMNDELMLIDMADMTTGPQGYDFMCLYRDFCLMPQRQRELAEQTMGMPAELIQKVWNAFAVRYLETKDSEVLEQTFKKLAMASAVNGVIMCGMMPEPFIASNMPSMKQRLIDSMLYPNLETIKNIFSNM